MKNYKLTNKTIVHNGITLYQIEAITNFNGIKKGTLGGYIQSTNNLSGNAWVGDDAKVYGNAGISGDAEVYGDAQVGGNTVVSGNAKIYGDVWVGNDAKVFGNAVVCGKAQVFGNAKVFDNAKVFGNAKVYGSNAKVYGNALVGDNACVYGKAIATGRVFNIDCVYNLTMTDNHILYGCIQKTIEEWKEFLDSDEVIETPRESDKFTLMKATLELALLKTKLKI